MNQYLYPVPTGLNVDLNSAINWSPVVHTHSEFPYADRVELNLPTPQQTLLLLSQGDLSAGTLRITESSADDVKVQIRIYYHEQAVRDVVRVGVVKGRDGENGVGIFTPSNWGSRAPTDNLYFIVELTFPRGSMTSHLRISNLRTNVCNFSQVVGSLKDIMRFETVRLEGSNGFIAVHSLVADTAHFLTSNGAIQTKSFVATHGIIRSTNGPIYGNYEVSESLDLLTSNGAIQANVTVNSSGTTDSRKALTMSTSNNTINSTVELRSSPGSPGPFDIKAQTSNGKLSVVVGSLPAGETLILDASTTNATGCVSLPSTFEGTLKAGTSNAAAQVARKNPSVDPSGRQRRLALKQPTPTQVVGNICWDPRNVHLGVVSLGSLNGDIELII